MTWVSTSEAAQKLHYHPASIRVMIKNGAISAKKTLSKYNKYQWLVDIDSIASIPERLGHEMERFPDDRVKCIHCMETLTSIKKEQMRCEKNL